jgi:hypothetical protein
LNDALNVFWLASFNMSAALSVALLALAGHAASQLTGRGFPDCTNGPLKNNTVCDTSAGIVFVVPKEIVQISDKH